MAEEYERRRSPIRLAWLLILFLLVAFCGFLFQWVNYKVVNVVNEYEQKRHDISRIRPAQPLWSRQEWNAILRDKQRKLSSGVDAGNGSVKSQSIIDSGFFELGTEVVKVNRYPYTLERVSTWKGTRLPRKSKRRKGNGHELIGKNDLIKGLSVPMSSTPTNSKVLRQPPPPSPDHWETTTVPIKNQSDFTLKLKLPFGTLLKTTEMRDSKVTPNMSTTNSQMETSPPPINLTFLERIFKPSSISKLQTITAENGDLKKTLNVSGIKLKVTVYPSRPISELDIEIKKKFNKNVTGNEIWKLPQLLNISHFKWLMNNQSFCEIGTSVVGASTTSNLFTVLVHSSRLHFNARQAIRQSWGSILRYKNWQIRLVFLLGEATPAVSENEDVFMEQKKKLKAEQEKYGDLIMGSFTDSYKNLTYKHLMGYKWILNFCQNAKFVLKTNDNIFVEIAKWIDWLNFEMETNEDPASKNLPSFMCKVQSNIKPIRKGTWAVSKEEWRQNNYPDFCHRWALGVSVDTIQRLYSVSNKASFLGRDEIFVTGVLRDVAQETYEWTPITKDISTFLAGSKPPPKPDEISELCRNGNWKESGEVYPVIRLSRDKNFEKNMMCLWKKTLQSNQSSGQ